MQPSQAFINPASASRTYDGFLAYAAFKDLGVEGRYEQALCKRLEKAGHACVSMLALATPTRHQDGSSRARAATTSGAQASIVIELADPATDSRRLLADGRPGYRVSLIDTQSKRVVAVFAIEQGSHPAGLRQRAARLADAVVTSLAGNDLLPPR